MKGINHIKYFFTLLGSAMLIGTLFMYKGNQEFIAKSIETDGIVIDLLEFKSKNRRTYKPLVQFTDNKGKLIEFTTAQTSRSHYIGEKVKVLYNPALSHEAKINSYFSLWGSAIFVGGFGALFLIVCCGIMIKNVMKKNKKKYLEQYGAKIETDFQNVNINTSLKVYGVSPFVVVSQWQNPETSKIHVFTSDNIWFDPTDFIKSDRIQVFIDRQNPKKYVVDLSFLPELAD